MNAIDTDDRPRLLAFRTSDEVRDNLRVILAYLSELHPELVQVSVSVAIRWALATTAAVILRQCAEDAVEAPAPDNHEESK